ncbi:hypothetical protein BDW71DRAFT_4429 [Aspergillus fruticulosus]
MESAACKSMGTHEGARGCVVECHKADVLERAGMPGFLKRLICLHSRFRKLKRPVWAASRVERSLNGTYTLLRTAHPAWHSPFLCSDPKERTRASGWDTRDQGHWHWAVRCTFDPETWLLTDSFLVTSNRLIYASADAGIALWEKWTEELWSGANMTGVFAKATF